MQLALRWPLTFGLCGIGEIFYLDAAGNKERLAGGASARGYSIQHGFVRRRPHFLRAATVQAGVLRWLRGCLLQQRGIIPWSGCIGKKPDATA